MTATIPESVLDADDIVHEVIIRFTDFCGRAPIAVAAGEYCAHEAARRVVSAGAKLLRSGALSLAQIRAVHVLIHETLNVVDPFFGLEGAGRA